MSRTSYVAPIKRLELEAPTDHENFKLTRVKRYTRHNEVLIRVYLPSETHELFKALQDETNLTIPTLGAMCIEYALKHLELIEPTDEE